MSARRAGSRPPGAACSRRAAVLTGSPVTSRWPAVGSPATTSPVWTPVRFASRTPHVALQLVVEPLQRARMLAAARTARSASSSWTVGSPKTAMMASPMNFSMVPPWRLELRAHRIEVARHELPQRLGVESLAEVGRPSQVREDDGDGLADLLAAGAGGASGAPQYPQRRKRSGFSSPQLGQRTMT